MRVFRKYLVLEKLFPGSFSSTVFYICFSSLPTCHLVISSWLHIFVPSYSAVTTSPSPPDSEPKATPGAAPIHSVNSCLIFFCSSIGLNIVERGKSVSEHVVLKRSSASVSWSWEEKEREWRSTRASRAVSTSKPRSGLDSGSGVNRPRTIPSTSALGASRSWVAFAQAKTVLGEEECCWRNVELYVDNASSEPDEEGGRREDSWSANVEDVTDVSEELVVRW